MKAKQPGDIAEYYARFVQPLPRYCIKAPGGKAWHSVKAEPQKTTLTYNRVKNYLTDPNAYRLACLPKWYPTMAALDLDDVPPSKVDEVMESFNLDDDNSEIYESESRNSYHIFFRPEYNQKPCTIRLLHRVFSPYARTLGIEFYPSPGKAFRLPFSITQKCITPGKEQLTAWYEKMYWNEKIDTYDISEVPVHQQQFDCADYKQARKAEKEVTGNLSAYKTGRMLYEKGLQHPGTRHECQFYVLYYLRRRNVDRQEAIRITYFWIKGKNNGFSKTIDKGLLPEIKKEIERQADCIYSTYALPDSTHMQFFGYIAVPDLPTIIEIAKGSLPRARFLFHLLKYYYPRRNQNRVAIHRDRLIEWASERAYLKRLAELEAIGLIRRSTGYRTNLFSKSIDLTWKFKSIENAILVAERSPLSLETTIPAVMEPRECTEMLISNGMRSDHAQTFAKKVYSDL